jgi:hypothetical protein
LVALFDRYDAREGICGRSGVGFDEGRSQYPVPEGLSGFDDGTRYVRRFDVKETASAVST